MIPENKWRWFGYTGHLCVGHKCRFHLCTQVGKYLISTIGAYFPKGAKKMETIGLDRLFETMVFEAGDPCTLDDCMCMLPDVNGSEIDMEGYNTAGEAQKGHLEMCRKYAEME